MSDIEFIHRAKELLDEEVKKEDQRRSENRWSRKNPEGFKKCRSKYEKSELGKASCSLRSYVRRSRMELAKVVLGPDDRKEIGRFYINCPPGYEVDHIIPIAKGGSHTIDNLQYLTKSENRQKSAKTFTDQCRRITSNQMVNLNMEEMRMFLPWLIKSVSEKLCILPSIHRALAPKPISCANVRLAINKLKNI